VRARACVRVRFAIINRSRSTVRLRGHAIMIIQERCVILFRLKLHI